MSESLYETRNNKYSYSNQEVPEKKYLFELNFINSKNNYIIRKIKSLSCDKLISLEDQIRFKDLQKIKITIINVNNPKKSLEMKIKINKNKNSFFISNKNIQFEISKITM